MGHVTKQIQLLHFFFFDHYCEHAYGRGRVVLHTVGKSQDNYMLVFEFLKKLIGPNDFNGRGEPNVIMTNDGIAERKALQACFPKSTMLLCTMYITTIHILQVAWLWNS